VKVPIVYYVGQADAPATTDGHPVVDTPTALFAAIRSALSTVA
jgi:hypothetical protein